VSTQPPPTARQVDVLRFIAQHTAEHGYPPTHREICVGIGVESTHGVAQHIEALKRKGLVSRKPLVSRGVVVTALGRALLGDEPHDGPFTRTSNHLRNGVIGPVGSEGGS